jgi:hypothetical protein
VAIAGVAGAVVAVAGIATVRNRGQTNQNRPGRVPGLSFFGAVMFGEPPGSGELDGMVTTMIHGEPCRPTAKLSECMR